MHEEKIHGGQPIKVKTVGAPENPFAAAKKMKSEKETATGSLRSCAPSSSTVTSSDVSFSCDNSPVMAKSSSGANIAATSSDETIEMRPEKIARTHEYLPSVFIVCLMFVKLIMFKTRNLTEQLESPELNIIDVTVLITSTTKTLTMIRENDDEFNNLIRSAQTFGEKLGINAMSDYNTHHRRRIAPRRLDEHCGNEVHLDMLAYYRKEFKAVLDTLITSLNSNIQACIENLTPIYNIFKLPLKRENLSINNLEEVLKMFPNQAELPNVNALQAEMEVLFDHSLEATNMKDVVQKASQLKCLKLALLLIKFVVTIGYSTATNERKFSLLKFIKSDIRSTMGNERVCDLMLIKSEKDLADKTSLSTIASSWAELKHRRISIQ